MTVRAELHDGTVLEFPDGTSDEVVSNTVKRLMGVQPTAPQPPERSFGEEALRKAEFASRGVSDSILETIGAVPDAIWSGVRALGLPAPEGKAADTLKQGWNAVGKTISAPLNAAFPGVMDGPKTAGDKLVYGAGRGVGDALTVMAPAAGAARVAQAGGLTRGVAETLAAQPVVQAAAGAAGGGVGEATDSPLMGILASLAVPASMAGASRVVSPVRNQLNPEQARLAAAAAREGIQLTPAQATGSKPLQAMEAVMGTLPMTSGPQRALEATQREAFNRAVLSRAGVQADRASPEVLDDAFRVLGRQFDDLARRTTVQVDDRLFKEVDAVASEYGRRLPTDVAPVFQSYVDDLNTMRSAMAPPPPTGSGAAGAVVPASQTSTVQIPGEAFQNIVSGLRARARSAQNNPALQTALDRLADAVDRTMVRSATPEVASAWRQARRNYRNLLTIDKAMSGGTQADRAAGDIAFGAFRQAVRQSDPRGFARGRGEMNDLARIGDFLGAARIPTSGTSERNTMTSLLTGGGLAGGGALAGGADPLLSLAVAGGATVLPRALQMAYNSPAGRAWLTNQLAAGAAPAPGLLGAVALGREKDIRGLLGGP